MDKFDRLIHDVSEMSKDDQNKAIEEYKGSCICPTCPTWNKMLMMQMKNFSV